MKTFSLTVVLAVAIATGSVAAADAARHSGWTLSYKTISAHKTSRTIVARTRQGKIAVLGLGRRRSYLQFDGRVVWTCAQGRRCRVAAHGVRAKRTAHFLDTEFFDPYGKGGLATAFMVNPKPAGRRAVAGVASTCKRSSNSPGHGPPDLLCTADRGGFLTLLKAAGETYELQRAVPAVRHSFFAIPRGIWDGRL